MLHSLPNPPSPQLLAPTPPPSERAPTRTRFPSTTTMSLCSRRRKCARPVARSDLPQRQTRAQSIINRSRMGRGTPGTSATTIPCRMRTPGRGLRKHEVWSRKARGCPAVRLQLRQLALPPEDRILSCSKRSVNWARMRTREREHINWSNLFSMAPNLPLLNSAPGFDMSQHH